MGARTTHNASKQKQASRSKHKQDTSKTQDTRENTYTMFGSIARALGSIKSKFMGMFAKWMVKDARITMVGLDAAGKTTMIYKLALGETVSSIPTIGFNVESVQIKNVKFTCWDIGGQDKIRPLWKYYYNNLNGIIYVVDSNDPERLRESREELEKVLSMNEDDLPILIYANKQDLPNAMSAAEVAQGLGLGVNKTNPWYIQSCSALSGDGLYEGMEWLREQVTA